MKRMTNAPRLLLLLLLATGASACTMTRPPNYALPDTGQIVAGETYTVGHNENVYAIAQKQGVKMREIIALNALKPPFALKAGQTLTLPAKDRFAAPTPRAAPLDYIDKGAMAPITPTPLPSYDASGGAGTMGVASQPLELPPIAMPEDQKPKTIYTQTPAPPPVPLPSAQETLPTPSSAAPPVPEPSTPGAEPEQPAPAAPAATAPEPSQDEKSAAKDVAFVWPVRGTIISAFGPKSKGLDNDGINIAAPKGSPVKAAASGIVAYAGNEMKGFGNLVLIRHEGGWVTAYAHLDRLVVARDAVVARGDMIGTVGASGGVASPQLHFETRREGKPVDPELVMK